MYKIKSYVAPAQLRRKPRPYELTELIMQCLRRGNTAQEMVNKAKQEWDISAYPLEELKEKYNTYALIREMTTKRSAFGKL